MSIHGYTAEGPVLKVMHGPWNSAKALELSRCGHLPLFGRIKRDGRTEPTFPINDLQHDEKGQVILLSPHEIPGPETVLSQITDIMNDGEVILKISLGGNNPACKVSRLQVTKTRITLVAEV